MNSPTLAKSFDKCIGALRARQPDVALTVLESLDPRALPPAAARLHAQLLLRARLVEPVSESRLPDITLMSNRRLLSACDSGNPMGGVSLVTACMNRQANLLRVLPSWLESGASEIIIVDWSSNDPVWPMLKHIADDRLKVVRIDDERLWILTHAFNVGLRLARREFVFKLDADIQLAPDFLKANQFASGEFVRGFWRTAVDAGDPDQRYTNGSFGARKSDLRRSGYYDERIQTYGWDDSDLYSRLAHGLGLAGKQLRYGSLQHLQQEEGERLANQLVRPHMFLGRFAATEVENLTNKFQAHLNLDWSPEMPAQDYLLSSDGARLVVGRRVTEPIHFRPGSRHLADILAASQFGSWCGEVLRAPFRAEQNSTEFGWLLHQAQTVGKSESLVSALQRRRGVHCFRAARGAVRDALVATIKKLLQHETVLASMLIIVEDDAVSFEAPKTGESVVFRASSALIGAIVASVGAERQSDFFLLEEVLTHRAESCSDWIVDFDSLAAAALSKASALEVNLSTKFEPCTGPVEKSALVTSLYDEGNLLRLTEYLACMVLNLRAFQYLLVFYEARDGLTQLVVQALIRRAQVQPERLLLIAFDRRPTFANLFGIQTMLPIGTMLSVANADVAFDATLASVAGLPLEGILCVLTRQDVDEDGRCARLIRIENGTPNTLSADAWIVRTPFDPDFCLDYLIGSYHCDSFINNQVSRSIRYRIINPCLDVHIFHLHDARFNSSAEKHVRDWTEIQRLLAVEKARNGGEAPIKGAPWMHLRTSVLAAEAHLQMHWRPRALVLNLTRPTLGALAWLHLSSMLCGQFPDMTIVAKIPQSASGGPIAGLLARYKRHFGLAALQFDIDDEVMAAAAAISKQVKWQQADVSELAYQLDKNGVDALADKLDAMTQYPAEATIYQTRLDLRVPIDTEQQVHALDALIIHAPQHAESLRQFLATLESWSDEARAIAPFSPDLTVAYGRTPALHLKQPNVCFVTSLFRGGEFLPGYMENVAVAAAVAGGEIVLVDANCDDHDTAAIADFFREHPEWSRLFTILRLDEDPGLYRCWELAIERSRSEFITNANIDDRRSPQHTLRLVQGLRERTPLAGAAGSISAVKECGSGGWFELVSNQIWFRDLGDRDFGFSDLYALNSDGTVQSHNIMHCMPVWRRSLHERYGYFDEEQYGTSCDWAFWLKCALAGERFWLDSSAFGRYYINPNSHNRRHDAAGIKERRIISDYIGIEQKKVEKQ